MVEISRDMADLLRLFAARGVEFLVCGGHAVAFHGYVRMTMDLDILILPGKPNAARIMAALQDFGFGQAGITAAAFETEGTAISLGAQPNQIDLLTSISSRSAETVFRNAVWGEIGGQEVRFVSLHDLVRAKREAARPKDRVDIDELERVQKARRAPGQG